MSRALHAASIPPWAWALLAAIVGLGGSLRFHELAAQSLWIDEGFSVMSARAILEHGYPLLASGEVSWRAAPTNALIALGLTLFDDLHIGARFFSAACGTLSILGVFLLGRRLFGSTAQAVLAALLLAVLTYEVAWSRQARMYPFLECFLIWEALVLCRFVDQPRPCWLVATTLLAFAAVLTHRAGYLGMCIAGLVAVAHLDAHRRWIAWIRQYPRSAIAVAGLWLGLGLVLVLADTHASPSDVMSQLSGNTSRGRAGPYASFVSQRLGGLLAWSAIGAGLGAVRYPRFCLPFLVAMAAYFYVISQRTDLFHFRYIFPILWMLILFAAYGLLGSIREVLRLESRRIAGAAAALIAAAFTLTCVTAEITIVPRTHYWLGEDAPQPDWARAYHWIAADHRASATSDEELTTIALFPMFHDLYLGSTGRKFFLPHRFSYLPGHALQSSHYSSATTIVSLGELRATGGYVLVDDYGHNMILDEGVRAFLELRAPTHVVQGPGPVDVHIWKLRPGALGRRRDGATGENALAGSRE